MKRRKELLTATVFMQLSSALAWSDVSPAAQSESMTTEDVSPYFAEYEVRRGGIKVATVNYGLWKDGDVYVYESSGSASGFLKFFGKKMASEEARFVIKNGMLQQLEYKYTFENSDEGRNRNIRFDWDKNIVSLKRRGKTRQFKLQPDMVDRLLLQLKVMLDMKKNRLQDKYVAIGKRGLNNFIFEKKNQETVVTPAGKFETRLVTGMQIRRKGDRITRYWCAPELEWLPVKIEQHRNGDGPFIMLLTRIQGLGR